MDRKKKKKYFKVRYLIVFVFAIYVFSVFISQHKLINKLNSEKMNKEKEVEMLKSEINKLEEKIKNAESPEYIEKIAREELKMIKSGEIIYIDKEKYKNKFIEGINH